MKTMFENLMILSIFGSVTTGLLLCILMPLIIFSIPYIAAISIVIVCLFGLFVISFWLWLFLAIISRSAE